MLRGFTITGANNYTTGTGEHSPIESDDVRKTPFFYIDGGGIKIYARSYPTIERVEVVGNYTSPCGAGVSVEHLGRSLDVAVFRDCIFRDNRTQMTGAAFDLLHGSRATLDNCLFVGNIANLGVDYVGLLTGGEYHPEHGSGAMTVFEGSRATVSRCTFTGNWAGVDDNGTGSTYVKSIFWNNTLKGGISTGARYEIDITDGGGVRESFIHGETNDLRGTIDRASEHLRSAGSALRRAFVPQAPEYARAGYRPAVAAAPSREDAPALSSRLLLLAPRSANSSRTAARTICVFPAGHVTSMRSTLRPRRARSRADTRCARDTRSCRPAPSCRSCRRP